MAYISVIFSSIWHFIKGFFQLKNYNWTNAVLFMIVLMVIQYYPLEGSAGVSPVKVAMMAVMPIIFLANFNINKAVVFGAMYWLWIFYTAYFLHPYNFRSSTVMYTAMFVVTFMVFYTLIYNKHVLTIDVFINFIRCFIYAYTGLAIIQTLLHMVGIWNLPWMNMIMWVGDETGMRVNSFSQEPSTFARTLWVLYYAYLKCNEYLQGSKVTIFQAFKAPHLLVSVCVLLDTALMGSATCFIAMGVVSLYFLRGYYLFLTLPIFIGIFFILRDAEIKHLERAVAVAQAASTMNAAEIRKTDTSAAVRAAPIINTISNFSKRLDDEEFWIGHGCDYSLQFRKMAERRNMGDIDDYGLIAFILSFVVIFTCCIRFRSLATILLLFGLGGGTNNVAYSWGLLYIFSATRYFYDQKKLGYLTLSGMDMDIKDDIHVPENIGITNKGN